jgi:hypothetical protein
MQVPARLGEQRFYVAARAAGLALEQLVAALGCFRIERSGRRVWRLQAELIQVQRRELGRDEVGIVPDVVEPGRGRDRELRGVL